MIDRAKSNDFNYGYATFLNVNGEELTTTERTLLNQDKLAMDFYENKNGQIVEVRVRPMKLVDKFLNIQLRAIANNPLSQFKMVEINCDQLDSMYSEVRKLDQEVRNEGGNMQTTDSTNRQAVVSAISKCGFTEDHIQTIWLVFQHSPSELMAYYYPYLKEFSEKGILRKSSIALMEDRLLMNNGYKQIYGSQIRGGTLYNLESPDSVNFRRASMQLGSIEDYIARWGLDFEEEKIRMLSK